MMRHFSFLTEEETSKLFYLLPEDFSAHSDKELLSVALGATLYCPATRTSLLDDVRKMGKRGATSVIVCLEDSVPDSQLENAEDNLYAFLQELESLPDEDDSLPLVFIRIRNPLHLNQIYARNKGHLSKIVGFVFPKFDVLDGTAYQFVSILQSINHMRSAHGLNTLFFMPVLESPNLIFRETRDKVLQQTKALLGDSEDVLAIRIGATDMASPFGLRRSRDLMIYDVQVVASAIGDIVNFLGRSGTDGHVVTGPVWEHFTDRERLFKPRLRERPFEDKDEISLRKELLKADLDGLIREVELDRANGLLGKTVIHPTHVPLVNSLLVVSKEEYFDACDILEGDSNGAQASTYRNKMNEVKPHTAWAKRTLLRARAYGVAEEDITFVDLWEGSLK